MERIVVDGRRARAREFRLDALRIDLFWRKNVPFLPKKAFTLLYI